MEGAQDWLDKAKERSAKAAWVLNRLRAEDKHAEADLLDAMDKLHTALEHCKDAARKMKIDYSGLMN